MGKIDKVKKLLKDIADYKKRYEITENSSTAEKLVHELSKKHNSDDEYLELQKRVKVFLESDASEEDKQMVMGYAESLSMMCSAIKDGLL